MTLNTLTIVDNKTNVYQNILTYHYIFIILTKDDDAIERQKLTMDSHCGLSQRRYMYSTSRGRS